MLQLGGELRSHMPSQWGMLRFNAHNMTPSLAIEASIVTGTRSLTLSLSHAAMCACTYLNECRRLHA